MDKFMLCSENETKDGILRDCTLESAKGIVDYLPPYKAFRNPVLNMIERACLSYRINKKFHVPFQSFWYNLDSYNYEDQIKYHMMITSYVLGRLSIDYLKKFKANHKNVRLYALLVDSMHTGNLHMDSVRDKLFSDVWDSMLTYDKYDAEEYGFTWFGYTYYSSYDFVSPDPISSDIYYVGVGKGGRERTVLDVYKKIRAGG